MKPDFGELQLSYKALERLLSTLALAKQGDFSVRMEAEGDGMEREVADTLNELLTNVARCVTEQDRVAEAVASGDLRTRNTNEKAPGGFGQLAKSMNASLSVFAKHTAELRRTIKSIVAGDFSRVMATGPEAVHRGGELQRTAEEINAMIAHVDKVIAEVTRVFAEVGLDGRLNAQCHLSDANGSWALLTGSVNAASASLSEQVQDLCAAAHALGQGNLGARASLTSRGDLQTLKVDLNAAAEAMSGFCAELRRVAISIVSEGPLKVELHPPNPRGDFQAALDACNRQFVTYAYAFRLVTEAAQRIQRSEALVIDEPLPGEIGATIERLTKLAEREVEMQSTLEQLSQGNFDARIGGEGVREETLTKLAARLKSDARSTVQLALREARERNPRVEAFANAALVALAQLTGAVAGACHVLQEDGSLHRVATFGWNVLEGSSAITPAGSGLLGRVALEKKPLQLDDLEDERVRIRASMLDVVPRSVLVYPIQTEDRVVAVLEFGFLRPTASAARELLASVANDLLHGLVAQPLQVSGDRLRAAEEELVISNTRLERLKQELISRDKVVRELQVELQSARAANDAGERRTG
jgi:methyl-accepting chemotaxis protein